MADILWAAAGLLLMLPAEMKPVVVQTERIAVLNLQPPVLGHTDQLFCSWSDGKGARVTLHWWNAPRAPIDYGPMSPVEDWEVMFGDKRAPAALTDMFMGKKQEVLVTWPPVEDRNASAMLHAVGISRESFDRMLQASRILDARKTMSMTCEPIQARSQ